jgi:hypothetical protein
MWKKTKMRDMTTMKMLMTMLDFDYYFWAVARLVTHIWAMML